jgi:hypothetical protein
MKAPRSGMTHKDPLGPQSQGFQHVRSPADTTVQEDRDLALRSNDHLQPGATPLNHK